MEFGEKSVISLGLEIDSLRTRGKEVILFLSLENPNQELSFEFFLGKTIEGLRILQRVFESVIPMFVNHNLTYGQAVSPSFHANFAQKHGNAFSLLILRASYQHHQKRGNSRTSALCCLRTAK